MPGIPNPDSSAGGGGIDWGGAIGSAMGGPGGLISGVLGGLLGKIFEPSLGEKASQQSKLNAAGAQTDYNAGVANKINFDPNFAARNVMQARKMAYLLNNVDPNFGTTAIDRDTTGNFQQLYNTLMDPRNQGMYANNQGQFDWRSANFNPTTLDKKGNVVNQAAPTMGRGNIPTAPMQPPKNRPQDLAGGF